MNTNIKFYLKEGKKSALIMLKLHNNVEKMIYSTGYKIQPEDWNGGMPRQISNRNDLARLSVNLNKLKIDWITAMLELEKDGIRITKDLVVNKIKPNKSGVVDDVITIGNSIIERKKEQGSSYTCMQTTVNILEKWKGRIEFNEVNSDFYDDFITYLQNKNLSLNTIGKQVRNLKQMMNTAFRKRLTTNADFKDYEFKSMSERVKHIYLTEEELYQIGKKKLPEHLDNIRDLFLIGAWSGLRHSDFSRLTTSSIGKFIKIRQKKTRDWVTIPIHSEIKRILAKRNGELPQPVTSRKMNVHLKTIAEMCDINSVFRTEKTIGGKTKVITKKKWELVCTHTARRSLATNLAKRGVPISAIMPITGHSTVSSCSKYIDLTQEDIATTLANNPFFQ